MSSRNSPSQSVERIRAPLAFFSSSSRWFATSLAGPMQRSSVHCIPVREPRNQSAPSINHIPSRSFLGKRVGLRAHRLHHPRQVGVRGQPTASTSRLNAHTHVAQPTRLDRIPFPRDGKRRQGFTKPKHRHTASNLACGGRALTAPPPCCWWTVALRP